jgi:glycosyltransferase involved in cell wall biosynthesis
VRIAIVCENDASSACTRYRAVQFAPLLAERLGSVDVLLPHPPVSRGDGARGRVRFFASHALAYASRVRELRDRISSYDVVLVQRAAYPLGPGFVTRALERFSGRLVLDLDDALFIPRPTMAARSKHAQWLYGPAQATRILARADAVVAGSAELAAAIAQRRNIPVTVLPTIPDVARYPVARHAPRQPLKIGWIGTAGNRMYLDPLAPVFARLTAEGVASLEVVSSQAWAGPSTFRRWSAEEEASVFARYDVTIMPLPDTPYTRAKAGFKLLQSLAAGVGVVASPVGVNRALIEDSRAGLLAVTAEQWEECLRSLASDPELRAELGARGRVYAERTCDIPAHVERLASFLAA